MAPATPGAPLSESLQKFLDRRGEGLYALMLEAADPDAEADDVATRGLDVLPLMEGASGRDLHPRSTSGVLIRIYPDNSVGDQGPHDERAPYFSGIMKVIVATSDAQKAASIYGEGLGLDVDKLTDDPDRGVTVATVRPPKGGTIELVSAIDTTRDVARRIDEFVTTRGPGMYRLVVASADVAAAVSTLRERGVELDESGSDGVEALVYGTRILIDERSSNR
jgi:catechol 2,3-dioxygenase-like lactoylglutathione lyase family enzyme